jgi:ribosomal protein S12 methylthiotransferase
MKRPASGEKVLERVQAWRKICPDLTIRSTFIAGFPGETEEEFQTLLDFLIEAQLDRVGCFAYSPVDGATANALPGALPLEVREERQQRFMRVQSAVSAKRLQRFVGREMQVLVDGVGDDGRLIARSAADAPEIDGVVFVSGRGKIAIGDFVRVKVTATEDHDLSATLLSSSGVRFASV